MLRCTEKELRREDIRLDCWINRARRLAKDFEALASSSQDGKVTVPHEDFTQKIRALRQACLELGVDDGIIVCRTDSLGAGLTKHRRCDHSPLWLIAAAKVHWCNPMNPT